MHIVFFSLFRTENPYSSISLSMAKELAKTCQVIYVNHPYSLKDFVRGLRAGDPVLRKRLANLLTGRSSYERLESIPDNFIGIQPPLTLPINWLPAGKVYDFFQRLNNGIILRTIQRALRREKVEQYLYINCYNPFYAGILPKSMGAKMCIYHCIDDITQNAYTDKHGTRLENEAIGAADLTFVTSTNLLALKQPYSDRIVTYFNAADMSVFNRVRTEQFERPAVLEGRAGKVIGFIGNLDELRIDYPLIKKVAIAHKDKTILLVGPVNSPELSALGIDTLPNIVLAGSRKLEDLPPLLQHMDVVLIPFLCNTLTRSIYPLKINEYLAAGKPVVSTAFSADIATFKHCICLADNHADFVAQIDTALATDSAALIDLRVKTAQQNTWAARIGQLFEYVERGPTDSFSAR